MFTENSTLFELKSYFCDTTRVDNKFRKFFTNNPTKSKEKYKKSVDLLLEKIEFKDEKYKNIEETYKVLNCLLFSDLIDFDEC